jgi:hypothetical protein
MQTTWHCVAVQRQLRQWACTVKSYNQFSQYQPFFFGRSFKHIFNSWLVPQQVVIVHIYVTIRHWSYTFIVRLVPRMLNPHTSQSQAFPVARPPWFGLSGEGRAEQGAAVVGVLRRMSLRRASVPRLIRGNGRFVPIGIVRQPQF